MGNTATAWTPTCNNKTRCVIVFLSGVAISHVHPKTYAQSANFFSLAFGKPCAICIANSASSDRWFVPRCTAHFVKTTSSSQGIIVLSHFRALFLFCCGFVSGCSAFAQHVTLDAPVHSPHGTALKISCQECHTTQGWK